MIELADAIAQDAAVRRIQRLQPAGGIGDKLFPPTYPAPQGSPNELPSHVFERRVVDGERVWTVLIDSVQSQANRLEEALLVAAKDGLKLPYVTVDFSRAGLDPLAEVTSLDAPHRVYDAILRDSLLGNESFMRSEQGQRLASASPSDATALLELSPAALVFGAWHSQGQGGGLGAKFARVLVSEIMGINVPVDEWTNPRTGEIFAQSTGRRTGSRIDPLGVRSRVEVYESPTDWATTEDAAGRGAKRVPPSKINHGNIRPTVTPLGVTCAHAEHRAVISLAGLRRLRFGSDDRNAVARELLLLIGLIALSEQDSQGYALRSRCDLVCQDSAPVELVHPDGSTTTMELAPSDLRQRYDSAFSRAIDAGFQFDWLRLTPQPKLVEIVQRSRQLALEGAGADE